MSRILKLFGRLEPGLYHRYKITETLDGVMYQNFYFRFEGFRFLFFHDYIYNAGFFGGHDMSMVGVIGKIPDYRFRDRKAPRYEGFQNLDGTCYLIKYSDRYSDRYLKEKEEDEFEVEKLEDGSRLDFVFPVRYRDVFQISWTDPNLTPGQIQEVLSLVEPHTESKYEDRSLIKLTEMMHEL